MRLPIRVKLTFAFALAMSVVLGATGLFLYLRFASELDRAIDQGLRSQAQAVHVLITQTDGALRESGRLLERRGQTFAQVISHGRVADFTPPVSAPLLGARALARAAGGPVTFQRGSLPGISGPLRLLATPVAGQDGDREIVVTGTSLADRDQALAALAALLTLGGAGALLLAAGVGYLLCGFALRSVDSMRRRAATLSLADAGGRLPVPRARDELWKLGTTLNEMLARNESAFARERAFTADASHELRTPLAILRAELEIALRAGARTAEVRQALASAAEESERLSRLVEELLLIARAEQGNLEVGCAGQSARDLLERVVDRVHATGKRRPISIRCPPGLTLTGEAPWLEDALFNMLDNAIRHGGGRIELSAARTEDAVELRVTDEGPGFPDGFLEDAFERFARAERGRTSEGTGLGLSIVRSVARAHGGDAHAANRPRGGAQVWLVLPDPTRAAALERTRERAAAMNAG